MPAATASAAAANPEASNEKRFSGCKACARRNEHCAERIVYVCCFIDEHFARRDAVSCFAHGLDTAQGKGRSALRLPMLHCHGSAVVSSYSKQAVLLLLSDAVRALRLYSACVRFADPKSCAFLYIKASVLQPPLYAHAMGRKSVI